MENPTKTVLAGTVSIRVHTTFCITDVGLSTNWRWKWPPQHIKPTAAVLLLWDYKEALHDSRAVFRVPAYWQVVWVSARTSAITGLQVQWSLARDSLIELLSGAFISVKLAPELPDLTFPHVFWMYRWIGDQQWGNYGNNQLYSSLEPGFMGQRASG